MEEASEFGEIGGKVIVGGDAPGGVGLASEDDRLTLIGEANLRGFFDDGAIDDRLAEAGVGYWRRRRTGREEGDGGERGEDGDGDDDGFNFHRG